MKEFPLSNLSLWIDPIARDGPENMAVDEWLLETVTVPVLRIYRWKEGWGSLGRFGDFREAEAFLPGMKWVRRMTGGGIVDHRADWTYSLVVPVTEKLAGLKGAESYRVIHAALVAALSGEATLYPEVAKNAGGLCFTNPVQFDLLDRSGEKLAGAGQRRTKMGLLHQGSVRWERRSSDRRLSHHSENLANGLAAGLSEHSGMIDFVIPPDLISPKILERYGNPEWTMRR